MKIIKSKKGYYYKIYKNGKKRISKSEYIKYQKKQNYKLFKGGTYVNLVTGKVVQTVKNIPKILNNRFNYLCKLPDCKVCIKCHGSLVTNAGKVNFITLPENMSIITMSNFTYMSILYPTDDKLASNFFKGNLFLNTEEGPVITQFGLDTQEDVRKQTNEIEGYEKRDSTSPSALLHNHYKNIIIRIIKFNSENFPQVCLDFDDETDKNITNNNYTQSIFKLGIHIQNSNGNIKRYIPVQQGQEIKLTEAGVEIKNRQKISCNLSDIIKLLSQMLPNKNIDILLLACLILPENVRNNNSLRNELNQLTKTTFNNIRTRTNTISKKIRNNIVLPQLNIYDTRSLHTNKQIYTSPNIYFNKPWSEIPVKDKKLLRLYFNKYKNQYKVLNNSSNEETKWEKIKTNESFRFLFQKTHPYLKQYKLVNLATKIFDKNIDIQTLLMNFLSISNLPEYHDLLTKTSIYNLFFGTKESIIIATQMNSSDATKFINSRNELHKLLLQLFLESIGLCQFFEELSIIPISELFIKNKESLRNEPYKLLHGHASSFVKRRNQKFNELGLDIESIRTQISELGSYIESIRTNLNTNDILFARVNALGNANATTNGV